MSQTPPHSTCRSEPGRARIAYALRIVLAVLLAGTLAACAVRPPKFPAPLRAPNPPPAQDEVLQQQGGATRPRLEEGPTLPAAAPAAQHQPAESPVPPIPNRKPVALALDGVPLAAFINVVFGTELGFPIEIEQAVRDRTELVTLRLTEPQEPEKLYAIAAEVLRNYGVRVQPVGTLLRFSPIPSATGAAPRVVVTRALPDVPAGQRPVFVAIPLDIGEPGRIAAQVRILLGNSGVTITEMVEANALLLSGPGDAVQAAMDAVLTLDKAALRDKRSIRINPLYLSVDQLARDLREVLNAQGISVRMGPGTSGALTFVPVQSANALIVFSESEAALRAASEWAERLDQPTDESAGGGGVYLYSARHTTVETLVPILQTLVGGANAPTAPASGSAAAGGSGTPGAPQGQAGASNQVVSIAGNGGRLAVDPIRNVIVYQGDGQRWRAIQGVLARLDQPARQVVIEVTVAEVTLTDEFSHGIEWALRNINFEGMSGPLTALGGSQPNTGGLIWRAISSSGQVSALVNLFARDSRVSILSTPRLLVKSGEKASIDVGTEVPIITSQATAPDLPTPPTGGSSILQQIQYRKTGVLLEIEAVVHSGQRVDLKLTQEVSEATQTESSDIPSPSIFSRKLQTSLSLSDGESMLLGGLISSTNSDGKSKVPVLGDIPGLGRLFQNRRKEGTRTELLMLITPYVVEDATQAKAITEAVRARFGTGKEE